MTPRLLKPRPMMVVEQCIACARPHLDMRDYRRCSVCGEVFCWEGGPRGENIAGVESRPCGSRRMHASGESGAPRVEYRCHRHVTRSWVLFGADWPVVRPIALYIFLCVAFSVTFWGALFLLVSAWLHSAGIH